MSIILLNIIRRWVWVLLLNTGSKTVLYTGSVRFSESVLIFQTKGDKTYLFFSFYPYYLADSGPHPSRSVRPKDWFYDIIPHCSWSDFCYTLIAEGPGFRSPSFHRARSINSQALHGLFNGMITHYGRNWTPELFLLIASGLMGSWHFGHSANLGISLATVCEQIVIPLADVFRSFFSLGVNIILLDIECIMGIDTS